jgi:hypothetical protein
MMRVCSTLPSYLHLPIFSLLVPLRVHYWSRLAKDTIDYCGWFVSTQLIATLTKQYAPEFADVAPLLAANDVAVAVVAGLLALRPQ